MKSVFPLLLLPCVAFAEVTKSEPIEKITALAQQGGWKKIDWVKTVFSRNGVKCLDYIATDTDRDEVLDYHGYFFWPSGEKGGLAAHFVLQDGVISSLTTNQIEGTRFCIEDFTEDGHPDFIQIISKADNKVIEAYTIIQNQVEPIPDEWFREGRVAFDRDSKELIQDKTEQISTRENPSTDGDGG